MVRSLLPGSESSRAGRSSTRRHAQSDNRVVARIIVAKSISPPGQVTRTMPTASMIPKLANRLSTPVWRSKDLRRDGPGILGAPVIRSLKNSRCPCRHSQRNASGYCRSTSPERPFFDQPEAATVERRRPRWGKLDVPADARGAASPPSTIPHSAGWRRPHRRRRSRRGTIAIRGSCRMKRHPN